MYIRTIVLEREGLKAFRQEENALKERQRQEWWNSVLPIKMYDINEQVSEEDDELFEGGRSKRGSMEIDENPDGNIRRKKKPAEKIGIIQQMMSNTGSTGNMDHKPFQQMDKEE